MSFQCPFSALLDIIVRVVSSLFTINKDRTVAIEYYRARECWYSLESDPSHPAKILKTLKDRKIITCKTSYLKLDSVSRSALISNQICILLQREETCENWQSKLVLKCYRKLLQTINSISRQKIRGTTRSFNQKEAWIKEILHCLQKERWKDGKKDLYITKKSTS